MKVKYNIPFVVTSGGRLLTCSDLDSPQDNHNYMEQEFQQLKDSAFLGQDVEIRRGVIPIELDLEPLFTPVVVSPQTTEDSPPNPAPKPSAESAPKSSASTCTEKEGDTIYSTKRGEENGPLGEEKAITPDVLSYLKATAILARKDPKTELEKVSNDCNDALDRGASIVDQFTTEDQALLVADLSNAKFDEKFDHVIISVKDLQYLDSL